MEYLDENRGRIQERDRARQIIDFSGLKFGKITPTDIDGLIEYHNQAVIFMEFKYFCAPLPHGQQLALTRLVDNSQRAGKEAILLICEHHVSDCDSDIIASDAIVREFYYRAKWYHDGKTTVFDKIQRFLDFTKRR